MHFLAPVYVKCEICDGKRYNKETLAVQYKSKNISDILNMTVDDACEFFSSNPQVFSKLKTLNDVGLGYISIGQAATTLSGGEAQRIKLSKELSKRQTGKTLYILDEPTTGLHFDDIKKLLEILHKLVSYGNTVIVIEHNLDVVNTSDWIIDLGPEGGEKGGQILFEGLPKDIIKRKENQTGIYLKKYQESLALSTAS
jgi:excinuclease ABC subunit A